MIRRPVIQPVRPGESTLTAVDGSAPPQRRLHTTLRPGLAALRPLPNVAIPTGTMTPRGSRIAPPSQPNAVAARITSAGTQHQAQSRVRLASSAAVSALPQAVSPVVAAPTRPIAAESTTNPHLDVGGAIGGKGFDANAIPKVARGVL